MKHVKIDRQRKCEGCNGKGGSQVDVCTKCKGKGIIVKLVQMGPGMYSQTQSYCPECKGEGKKIQSQFRCKDCKGQKILLKSEKIEIPIEKGIKDKSKIEIKGKGNEHPEYRTGDLIVVVQVEEDKEQVDDDDSEEDKEDDGGEDDGGDG